MTRVASLLRDWGVAQERTEETGTSLVVFGTRGGEPVVLKVSKTGSEWQSGEVLAAFEGRGVARVLEREEGAMLMEWLRPGTPLASLALSGRDDEATGILADVIGRMEPQRAVQCPGVDDWSRAFDQYLAGGDVRIERSQVKEARDVFHRLYATQKGTRLLHGDLHHYNVLFDANRGWVAIDPKGVIGEVEYEVGAALRNPYEMPDLFTDARVVQQRVERFVTRLGLNAERVLAWAFAQAVLAAIWACEDGSAEVVAPMLRLADTLRPMRTAPVMARD